MTFVEMRWGGDGDCTGLDQIRKMISDMSTKDREHPDAWMTHDSGWTLTLHEQGLIIWGNPDEGREDRHIVTIDPNLIEELLLLLSAGKISQIEEYPWKPGRGIRPPTEAEIQEMEEAMMADDREWYDKLGPEDAVQRCATSGCQRGTLKRSVMCRVHHFEMIRNKPCPFHH